MNELRAEVLIELLPTDEGGRQVPLDLCNDNPGQYRPHFRVIGGSGELLGVAFMDGPDDPVLPGEKTSATVKSLYEPAISYSELVVGTKFEILEGPRVVGFGTVTRL
jgi:translation elongation factor EF-Tu-like GTPase